MFRACYGLRGKLGLLKRRFAQTNWSGISFSDLLRTEDGVSIEDFLRAHRGNGRRFFFSGDNLPRFASAEKDKKVTAQAHEILGNRFRYFFDRSYDLGSGPDWLLNPVTGVRAAGDRHWCDINLFDRNVGDIKLVWEPSRFAWAYTLVRAYAATGDEKYPEKFWLLLESWLRSNQPNTGPNYACGQECAIRLMAMCFVFYGFGAAESTSVERLEKLIIAMAVHADRIERNIDFAISTKTNHSLTEAAGLYTAGTLFPEFRRAERWKRLGKDVLEKESRRQIYADGCYIQHSMNYHRLMLQDFLWVFRLAELNGDSFSDEPAGRFEKAVEFLYEMQDGQGGRVPNYGANDGALIVPLNNCDYLDYRPVIQSCRYLVAKERRYESGPWDEDLMWFFGAGALKQPVVHRPRTSHRFDAGGYYTIRNRNSWAMVRCHSYRHRIGHIDLLHVDLWAGGDNLLRDCGTYKYFAPDEPDSEKYFPSIHAHNTVVIDGVPPLESASRFVLFPLPKAKVLKCDAQGGRAEWAGEHYAYARSPWRVVHERRVTADGDRWEITDTLKGSGQHKLELIWHVSDEARLVGRDGGKAELLLPGGWILRVADIGQADYELVRAMAGGGESLYYGRRTAGAALVVTGHSGLPATFKTILTKENTGSGMCVE